MRAAQAITFTSHTLPKLVARDAIKTLPKFQTLAKLKNIIF
ncbi:hypothetical protein HMPREF9078_00555 [Capnocytophaga sp. oral taxon 380 str. F0488]|nr:hypothetical protein HMPREF9078_00555 [Capnocytophaga sp. oral taxon 380 str. F0488]